MSTGVQIEAIISLSFCLLDQIPYGDISYNLINFKGIQGVLNYTNNNIYTVQGLFPLDPFISLSFTNKNSPYTCYNNLAVGNVSTLSDGPTTITYGIQPFFATPNDPSSILLYYYLYPYNAYVFAYYRTQGIPSTFEGWIIDIPTPYGSNFNYQFFISVDATNSSLVNVNQITFSTTQNNNQVNYAYNYNPVIGGYSYTVNVNYSPSNSSSTSSQWNITNNNNTSSATSTLASQNTSLVANNYGPTFNGPISINNSFITNQPYTLSFSEPSLLLIQSLVGMVHSCYLCSPFNSKEYNNGPSSVAQNQATEIYLNSVSLYSFSLEINYNQP